MLSSFLPILYFIKNSISLSHFILPHRPVLRNALRSSSCPSLHYSHQEWTRKPNPAKPYHLSCLMEQSEMNPSIKLVVRFWFFTLEKSQCLSCYVPLRTPVYSQLVCWVVGLLTVSKNHFMSLCFARGCWPSLLHSFIKQCFLSTLNPQKRVLTYHQPK